MWHGGLFGWTTVFIFDDRHTQIEKTVLIFKVCMQRTKEMPLCEDIECPTFFANFFLYELFIFSVFMSLLKLRSPRIQATHSSPDPGNYQYPAGTFRSRDDKFSSTSFLF